MCYNGQWNDRDSVEEEMRTQFWAVLNGNEEIPDAWHGLKEIVETHNLFIINFCDKLSVGSDVETCDLKALVEWGPRTDIVDLMKRTGDQAFEVYCNKSASHPIDVLVAEQDVAADQLVRHIRGARKVLQPKLIIRFSMYYGERSAPYKETLPPESAGYNLDCFKDFKLLYDLLTFAPFIEAVDDNIPEQIKEALTSFNELFKPPILIFNL